MEFESSPQHDHRFSRVSGERSADQVEGSPSALGSESFFQTQPVNRTTQLGSNRLQNRSWNPSLPLHSLHLRGLERMDPMINLPDDLILEIFRRLSARDIINLSRLNRSWRSEVRRLVELPEDVNVAAHNPGNSESRHQAHVPGSTHPAEVAAEMPEDVNVATHNPGKYGSRQQAHISGSTHPAEVAGEMLEDVYVAAHNPGNNGSRHQAHISGSIHPADVAAGMLAELQLTSRSEGLSFTHEL